MKKCESKPSTKGLPCRRARWGAGLVAMQQPGVLVVDVNRRTTRQEQERAGWYKEQGKFTFCVLKCLEARNEAVLSGPRCPYDARAARVHLRKIEAKFLKLCAESERYSAVNTISRWSRYVVRVRGSQWKHKCDSTRYCMNVECRDSRQRCRSRGNQYARTRTRLKASVGNGWTAHYSPHTRTHINEKNPGRWNKACFPYALPSAESHLAPSASMKKKKHGRESEMEAARQQATNRHQKPEKVVRWTIMCCHRQAWLHRWQVSLWYNFTTGFVDHFNPLG